VSDVLSERDRAAIRALGPAHERALLLRRVRHTPGGHPHNQQDHAGGGAVGLAKKAAKTAAKMGQAALDATPARLVDDGLGPRHPEHKRGTIAWSNGDPGWSAEETDRHLTAMENYRGADFSPINKRLRGLPYQLSSIDDEALGEEGFRRRIGEHIELLDDVMEHSRLIDDITVIRGTSTGRGVFGDALDGDLTDFEWTEGAYVSTTANPAIAEYFTITGLTMNIHAPKGTGAMVLSGMTGERYGKPVDEEAEVLLERGLRMRVVKDSGPGMPRQLEIEVAGRPDSARSTATEPAETRATGPKATARKPSVELIARMSMEPEDYTPTTSGKVSRSQLRELVAREVRALLRGDDIDDDPIGELDDDTLILLQAMHELDEESGVEGRAFNPQLHKRWPKGHPLGGKFRPMVDLLKEAIKAFDPAKDKHPFVLFKRPQLLKAAKARGITLQRGEDWDSIAAKLLADIRGAPAKPASAPAVKPTPTQTPSPTAVITKPGAKWPTGDATTEVHLGGDQLGIVVHNSKTGGFFPFLPSGSKTTPLGNLVRVQPGAGGGYQTEQSAVAALVRAHTPSKVSGPGLAGLSLSELRINPAQQYGGGRGQYAKSSHEISQNGTPLGTVHDFSYGWEVRDAHGNVVSVPQGSYFANKASFKTKSEALAALVSQKGTPVSKPGAPAPPSGPAAPTNTPPNPGTPHGPEIQAALDIVYGKDPKAKTMARQIAVYGALRRDQFDQLGPREQSTVLGDLAFIAATSKGKSATDAAKLVHRFTPAGTSAGTVHKQAIHIPPNVAAAQTRVTDPNGTAGLLKVRDPKDRGTSGDGWTRLPGGGTGPWGKYGAAGVMLRHVDPADGKERFLMVQRGPGISDPGKWQFPGGAIDSKESPHEGAARETAEELGFQAKDMLAARVHGTHETSIPNSTWRYTSIAATVDKQLKPDLSTHHARMETADAKWMTRDEIKALDTKGKLLKPLAGGQLETNVMTLFPGKAAPAPAGTPGKRPPRLTGAPTVIAPAAPVAPPTRHKPSAGKNLIPDKAAQDKLRADVSAVRKNYRGKTADERLAAIGAMQGFDDVPTVVSKKEMDKLLATGDYIEAWRGVGGNIYKTAAQINEEMRSGPAYYGTGIFGNGYYLSTRKNVAVRYSDHTKNSVIRVLIPKTAKIEEHSKVLKKAKQAVSSAGGFSPVGRRNLGGGTLHDEGRYAAAEGLDGIEIPSTAQSAGMGGASHIASSGQPAYNWVNRSVLIIQEADA